MSIAENLKKVKREIAEACAESGRASCALIAVSKTKPVSQILEAADCGQTDFGENYVQEAIAKIADTALSKKPLTWHFIGNLQSNKVHQVVGAFSLIHSVDRLSLAQAISKDAQKKSLVQNVLMQINVGDEESKSGVGVEDAPKLFADMLELKSLKICGLMCLPPLTDDLEKQKYHFRILRTFKEQFSEKLSDSQKPDFKILSMGTTHDFRSAIAEGATHVRVGTAIFGERIQHA